MPGGNIPLSHAPDLGDQWRVFGRRIPKQEAVFFSQVILIYTVVITCILNLSLTKDNSNLWTALLSSCLGYILPSPTIKSTAPKILDTSSIAFHSRIHSSLISRSPSTSTGCRPNDVDLSVKEDADHHPSMV